MRKRERERFYDIFRFSLWPKNSETTLSPGVSAPAPPPCRISFSRSVSLYENIHTRRRVVPETLYGLRSATSLCTLYIITVHAVYFICRSVTPYTTLILLSWTALFRVHLAVHARTNDWIISFVREPVFFVPFHSLLRLTRLLSAFPYSVVAGRDDRFHPIIRTLFRGLLLLLSSSSWVFFFLLNDTRHDTRPEENGGREILLY